MSFKTTVETWKIHEKTSEYPASILSHVDRMKKYMAFCLYFPAFSCYTLWVYIIYFLALDQNALWVCLLCDLRNIIVVGSSIIYWIESVSTVFGLYQNLWAWSKIKNSIQQFFCFNKLKSTWLMTKNNKLIWNLILTFFLTFAATVGFWKVQTEGGSDYLSSSSTIFFFSILLDNG